MWGAEAGRERSLHSSDGSPGRAAGVLRARSAAAAVCRTHGEHGANNARVAGSSPAGGNTPFCTLAPPPSPPSFRPPVHSPPAALPPHQPRRTLHGQPCQPNPLYFLFLPRATPTFVLSAAQCLRHPSGPTPTFPFAPNIVCLDIRLAPKSSVRPYFDHHVAPPRSKTSLWSLNQTHHDHL